MTEIKIVSFSAQVVPGILVVIMGYLGCNVAVIVAVMYLAVMMIPAAFAGAMANPVDIAPNYAGQVLGIAQTIHMTASFLSPMAVGYFTRNGVNKGKNYLHLEIDEDIANKSGIDL